MYLIVDSSEGTFVIAPKIYSHTKTVKIWSMLVVGLLMLILTLSFWVLKRVFSPIQRLRQGVEHVAEGHLDYRIPVRSNDELGKLSQTFNRMTEKIDTLLYSKEQLLRNISHELRSPLTRIKVAMEFLPDSSKKDDVFEDIRAMELMITDLLNVARLRNDCNELNIQLVDVTQLLKKIRHLKQEVFSRIDLVLPSSPVMFPVDPKQLMVVIQNLLDNALKYSANALKPVSVSLEDDPKSLIIRIRDYGHGIPVGDLPHIFDPFYRVDKSRSKMTGGSGLGLAVCKQIINAHGGTITVNSEFEQGAEFMIAFPRSKD